MSGEKDPVLIVDNLSQCLRVRLIANMPGHEPREFRQARTGAGLCHFRKAHICCIGKNGREQKSWVFCWFAALQMDEVPSKTRPAVNF